MLIFRNNDDRLFDDLFTQKSWFHGKFLCMITFYCNFPHCVLKFCIHHNWFHVKSESQKNSHSSLLIHKIELNFTKNVQLTSVKVSLHSVRSSSVIVTWAVAVVELFTDIFMSNLFWTPVRSSNSYNTEIVVAQKDHTLAGFHINSPWDALAFMEQKWLIHYMVLEKNLGVGRPFFFKSNYRTHTLLKFRRRLEKFVSSV